MWSEKYSVAKHLATEIHLRQKSVPSQKPCEFQKLN